MSAQHTAGPWKVSHDDFAGHYDVSTFDAERGSEAIAQVLYVENRAGGRGEADAHLIAAAPDLLELAYQYQSDLRHPPTADSVTRRLERIAAVLAKVGA